MSNRYKGAVISATPPTTTGGSSGTASGAWTLEQQMQLQAAGLWPSQPPPPNIEDVFSTYLYTGTGNAETITNGLNMFGKGGLVWVKSRSNVGNNVFNWNPSGGTTTAFALANTTWIGSSNILDFLSSGFTIKSDYGTDGVTLGRTYSTWAFRQEPKFFDVVTYTGTGTTTNFAHNLGSAPGCIIVKAISGPDINWAVYHRSLANTEYLSLNTTDAKATGATWWGSTTPTSSVFTVGSSNETNANIYGQTYVAFLFAHDAGGFGLTGTDNVISCGSWSTTLVGGRYDAIIDLGWEPQWILFKASSTTGNWQIYDNMRGWTANAAGSNVSQRLYPSLSNAEDTDTNTQLQYDGIGKVRIAVGASGQSGIYIAIRRGPMKVPTVGTSVFSPVARTGNSPTVSSITSVGFPPDSIWQKRVSGSTASSNVFDRLRGRYFLAPATTSAETAADTSSTRDLISFDMTGFTVGEQYSSELNANTRPEVYWNFLRAPGFFDEVCYTGTGSATTVTHNLTVAPQMMIIKRRSSGADWTVYHVAMGASKYTFLDGSTELSSATIWNATTPTASVFSVGPEYYVNAAASTYVAYLFATCAGVSKVGSYTGTGALQTVNCGFTTGVRFVLIHRIDSGSNNWFVYDSARGISSGDDPYLALNSTAVEVTGTNYVDTTSVGFQVTAAAPSGLNANGGTFIFLAIA